MFMFILKILCHNLLGMNWPEGWVRNVWAWVRIGWVWKIHGYETTGYHSKSTGGIRADLVLKVYALQMWCVLPSSSGENQELLTDVQDLEQNQSDFKYEATMVRISALGWSSDLRNLSEINFIQLYDYPVVSREYRHIVLRGTHYRKYHRSCSVWLRKRGKGCSPPGRGDLLLLLLLMWYLLLYHILQLKLFPFCSPRCLLVCHLYILSYGKLYNRACRTTWL